MKRNQSSRMPVQLGAFNRVHHPLQNHHNLSTSIGSTNISTASLPSYGESSFEMLDISSIKIDPDVSISPDGLQTSMLELPLEVDVHNRSNMLQNSFENQQNSIETQRNLTSDARQLCGSNLSTHIHRNSYSDSNSPSIVSPLSSSCSVSPQSADLSFGMISTYQLPNTTSANKDACDSLLTVPFTTVTSTQHSLSNLNTFSNHYQGNITTKNSGFSNSIRHQQQRQQQRQTLQTEQLQPSQNNRNLMIFDFETASLTPVLLTPNSSNGDPLKEIILTNTPTKMLINGGTQHHSQEPSSHQQNSKQSCSATSCLSLGTPSPNHICTVMNDSLKIEQNDCDESNNNNSIKNEHVCGANNNSFHGFTLTNNTNKSNNNNSSRNEIIASNSSLQCTVASHSCPNGVISTPTLNLICSNSSSNNTKSQCKVCGDTAIGKNFGVLTCGSCKIFFRRNCNEDKCKLLCRNNNNCVITKSNRRNCAHCRLQKCRDLGMKLKQSRHPRDIRRDIRRDVSTDDSDDHHCCSVPHSHCSLHQSDCSSVTETIDNDGCPIPDDLPSLISEDEARRRCEAIQSLANNDSLDMLFESFKQEDDDEFSDADEKPTNDISVNPILESSSTVTTTAAEISSPTTNHQPLNSQPISTSSPKLSTTTTTTTTTTSVTSPFMSDQMSPLEASCEFDQQPNHSVMSSNELSEDGTSTEINYESSSQVEMINSNIEQNNSSTESKDQNPNFEFDLDSPEAIRKSHQLRVATFLEYASEEDWSNYKKILGVNGFDKLPESDECLPENFQDKIIELYQVNRKRHRSDVELIKAEARNLSSNLDHQINELCQMTSIIRISMGIEYPDGSCANLVNKELEKIDGLNQSCQMIDIKPKNGPKKFKISDSLRQGIFYADKSFKLFEKFWSNNPDLKEMINVYENVFDTRKKNNLLHMLYHLRGVYNFDDNQDAWLVPSGMESDGATYIKLTMFNQSIKKEMTTIHKKYIQSFPQLWRDKVTIFNIMTFLLFFSSFNEYSHHQYERMPFFRMLYLFKRYMDQLYKNEHDSLLEVRRGLSLLSDLKSLCSDCLNACTHSFKLDELQVVAPNYADLLLIEESAKDAQASMTCPHHCKKARSDI